MKSHTDLEQSKTLSKILPIESADMYYPWDMDNKAFLNISIVRDDSYPVQGSIDCWSLAALLEYLRKHDLFPEIKDAGDYILMDITFSDENEVVGESINPVHFIRAEGKNILDACYELIIKLRENNLI